MRAPRTWLVRVALILLCAACAPVRPAEVPTPADIPRLEAEYRASPAEADALVRLAAAYREAGRLEDARTAIEQGQPPAREHPNAILLLGLTYEDLGQFADAQRLYARYLPQARIPAVRADVTRRMRLVERRMLEAAVREALAQESVLAGTAPQPRTVAVFPFLYVGPDTSLRPLGRAISEMLVTDLSQTGRLTVLERLRVQLLLDEIELAETGFVDPATAVRSGRLLGAGQVVQGSLNAGAGQRVGLQAAMVQAAAEASPRRVGFEGALARLFDLEKALALDLHDALGVSLTPAERELVDKRPTQNLQALLAFGRGLEAADARDFAAAAAHFSEAVRLDPGFEMARDRGERAGDMAEASRKPTIQLAREALAGRATAQAPPPPTLPVEVIVPRGSRRDATSEVLGREGLGRRSVLDVVLQRPSGGAP